MLQSSDETDPTEMEQKLTATYNGQSVTPEWNHQGNRHYFAIRHLLKEKESKTLNYAMFTLASYHLGSLST